MGGLGKNSKGVFMYHYVTDKEFLTAVRSATSDAVNRLVNGLNNMEGWHVGFRIIGSGGRNMPTQNENEPIDLDYNLVLEMTWLGRLLRLHFGFNHSKDAVFFEKQDSSEH